MEKNYKNRVDRPGAPTEIDLPRRQMGRIVHDHLGNARMEWAPLSERAATERQVLEVLDGSGTQGGQDLSIDRDYGRSFEPYGSGRKSAFDPPPRDPPRKPKDLRKLGEWLKLTRELEERRKRGED